MQSLSRRQVRSIDRCAIETLEIPGLILMENAARNATDEIEKFVGSVDGKSFAIVAGSGNNAGDGFAIARHLQMRGASVVTFLTAPAEKLTADAGVNLRAIRNLGHEIRDSSAASASELAGELENFDVIIDAVGGTGIRGSLKGQSGLAVEAINLAAGSAPSGREKMVVAIDIPTGLDCDIGRAEGPCVRADLTVTMLARKKGFDAPQSLDFTGEVRIVDIGVPCEYVAAIAAKEGREDQTE